MCVCGGGGGGGVRARAQDFYGQDFAHKISTDKILRFINTLIIIILHAQPTIRIPRTIQSASL